MNNNHYELVITVKNANGDITTDTVNIADPFAIDNKKEDKKQNKIENFAKNATKAIAINSSTAIVRSYTQTLGNSQLQEQIDAVSNGINFITQTAVATSTLGGIGLVMSILSTLPQFIGKIMSYNNGKTWDSISTNKALRRAGVEYNRSRN